MDRYTSEALELEVAYRQVQERNRFRLAAAKVFDSELAAKRKDFKRFGKSGRLNRQISTVAVMNAVNTEGREVMKDEGYWKDQDRRYFGITEAPRSVTAMRNRLGRVTYRKVYGREGVREYGALRSRSLFENRDSGQSRGAIENKNITIMVI